MMRATILMLISLIMLAGCTSPERPAMPEYTKRYVTEGKFEDVKQDIMIVIADRGLVINDTSHIAKMLDRTGKDLDTTKKIFHGEDQAQAFSFCSAVISRKTMEADPHNIVFCPYTIVIYVTKDEPKKVYVAYQRPLQEGDTAASKASLKAVDDLLDGIIREALNIQ